MKPFDEHEYRLIVDEYSDMIYKIAYQSLFNKEDAEDVVQDVFLRLLRSAKDSGSGFMKKRRFSDSGYLKAWLIRVAVNLCMDYKKSSRRKTTVPLEEWEAVYEPEEKEVLSVLCELPEDDRTVLYLYYYEQYTIKEIAGLLGKKQNTVNSRLSRAREKLKRIVEGDA